MKNGKINFYKFNNNNFIKQLFKNTLFIAFLMFLSYFSYVGTIYYFNYKSLSASTNKINMDKNNDEPEITNKYIKNLKSVDKTPNNKYEILINTSNKMTDQYLKDYEIVGVNNNLFRGIKLEKETYSNYSALKKNLKQRGYYINIKRGYTKENNVAHESLEHNTGLAIDITISKKESGTKTNYKSDEYIYLKNIAHLYGFIIRYPKEKENITGYNYNPFHLRYVGKELAKYLKKNNLTLEEYYEID